MSGCAVVSGLSTSDQVDVGAVDGVCRGVHAAARLVDQDPGFSPGVADFAVVKFIHGLASDVRWISWYRRRA